MLSSWHKAVKKIPLSAVLPSCFKEILNPYAVTNEANIAAFLGDKILGSHVARISFETDKTSLKNLTDCHSLTVSNALLAKHLKDILPDHVDEAIQRLAERHKHDAGTMVEAAVAAVDEHCGEEAHEAIDDLAKWLVQTGRNADSLDLDAKGQLLNMGGSVLGTEMPGAARDVTLWRAVAKLRGVMMVRWSWSKKESEQNAAKSLLALMNVHNNIMNKNNEQ